MKLGTTVCSDSVYSGGSPNYSPVVSGLSFVILLARRRRRRLLADLPKHAHSVFCFFGELTTYYDPAVKIIQGVCLTTTTSAVVVGGA